MTILGRYGDTSGSPYLEGRLVVPCLEISGDVSFLVDTGADYTALMPMDGEEMQVPFASDEFNQLEDSNAEGIGG